MNPFDTPPATPPVSLDPPDEPSGRRGRMVLVALAAAGLVGGGLVGVSHLVSADRPEVVSSDRLPSVVDAPGDEEPADEPADPAPPDAGDVDGRIVIDIGDGEPRVIDLDGGEIDELFDRFQECAGLPVLGEGPLFELEIAEGDFPFDEFTIDELPVDLDELLEGLPLDELDGLLDGTHITVAGPDGVSVIELGDEGSVTITQEDGEVTITTEGDATIDELPGFLDVGPLGEDFDPEQFEAELGAELEELFGEDFDPEAMLEELFGEDFDPEAMLDELFQEFGEFEEFGEFDLPLDLPPPAELQECLDEPHAG